MVKLRVDGAISAGSKVAVEKTLGNEYRSVGCAFAEINSGWFRYSSM
jgi:glutamate synthase domain-containing protein 2